MRYSDLIQFEPIESVIQLLDANRPQEAKKLVATYVISDEMAERIGKQIIPQLSFDEAVDHKGILIVGNYGTGKSHLMSVLSLVAEDAAYAPMLRHSKVGKAAAAIAGKFKVHRIEISSQMSLREIVTQELQHFLAEQGVSYTFPPADKVVNNKAAFEEMMTVFTEVHPNHGVLLVVDELLDYLRSRNDHDLILDLSFLREIGEVSKHLRFRFVAGVQEAIFDSSRFQHVADSLRRVQDRFTQVLLARQDVSFVVAERLLKKTADQQAKIRAYLTPFAKFYGSMNERMDEYVRLFPVHPDYIGTFERLVFTEKRGALVTLRDQIQGILKDKVPEDRPGLIGYDAFWGTVTANSVLRSDPSIGPVLKVSEVLSERVRKAARAAYRPMALRIIDGLAVHRLTTGGDIYVPIGPSAEELRDTLCLYHPGIEELGGDPAADLLTQVQTVLREIVKTVNGQFISKAPDTDQYYLDLKKDIDYDAQIEKRAETLSDDALDRAYFSAISQLMERAEDNQYVTGYKIWQYQIEWQERHAERDGYLFFGAPNDRPTAQPERDFYIYFIQPFNPPKFKDESKTDEVFFRLKGLDDAFRRHLSFYAAAQELASTASGGAKTIYLDKAQGALREMSKWLQEKQLAAYEVTYQGKTKTLQQWTKGINLRDKARLGPDDRINFRDVANVVSGLALAPHFQELAPDYPAFSMLLTRSNRTHMIGSALKTLAGGTRTKDATAVLDALDMLDADRIDPAKSRYAKEVLGRLKSKGHGQVVNRGELIVGTAPDVEHFSLGKSRLEPDLLVTVLGGLVYSGDIVLAITGDKIDSSKLGLLTERSLDELTGFKHIEAPKEINVAVLKALFELLGQAPGWAQKAVQGDEDAVKTLIESVNGMVKRVLGVTLDMANRLSFWGQSLLRDEEVRDWKAKLDALKAFLESLSPYNTVGKLKNLKIGAETIAAQKQNLELLATVERMRELVDELGPTASYLSSAELALKSDDPWVKRAQETRRQVLDRLAPDRAGQKVAEHRKTLGQLKKEYLAAYIAQHSRARLGVSEEKTQAKLRKDERLVALRALAGIELMPTSQLTSFEEKLNKLKSCPALTESELAAHPVCPHCQFNPASEQGDLLPAASALQQLDGELDKLLESWVKTLVDTLGDPIVQSNFELLKPSARKIVTGFANQGELPSIVTPEFVQAVKDAVSGLEKIVVTGDEIRQALLEGGSPVTPDELRKRFDALVTDRCKGKETSKLRFVVE